MPVLYEKRNHVGWLTLSRPEARNCWGDDFNEEIAGRCDEMASDPEIRLAVLTGDEAGGVLSAGANLKNPRTHAQSSIAEFIGALPQPQRSAGQVLTEFPKPVIAAVNGYAVGIGCIVTYCCDLIIASDRADRLSQLPPLASRLARESLNRGLDMSNIADAAFVDLYRFMALSMTEDAKESHTAWRERRRPDIRGA